MCCCKPVHSAACGKRPAASQLAAAPACNIKQVHLNVEGAGGSGGRVWRPRLRPGLDVGARHEADVAHGAARWACMQWSHCCVESISEPFECRPVQSWVLVVASHLQGGECVIRTNDEAGSQERDHDPRPPADRERKACQAACCCMQFLVIGCREKQSGQHAAEACRRDDLLRVSISGSQQHTRTVSAPR